MINNAQRLLGVLLHAPRGPFYSPKAARSHWEHSWKAILAFYRLAHRTLSGADFFPSLAKPTVGGSEPLAHRTLFGAHRTVRCPLLTVGSATRRARITRPTVGPDDRWLTGQSGAPPDSPVNYSRTPLIASREQSVDRCQPGAPDTVRCTQTAQSLGCLAKSFPNWSFPVSST
jgi:hypothetical protein